MTLRERKTMSVRPTALMILMIFVALSLSGCVGSDGNAMKGDPVRIVGSSTVFPFSAKVAEIFSDRTGAVIIVERTGSGGGHQLFCGPQGAGSPDITNSSRPQKSSEYDLCRRNQVSPVVEVQIGYDGIALVRSREAGLMSLSLAQLYLAIAKDIPLELEGVDGSASGSCDFQPNPHQFWSDLAPELPRQRIEFYGPPPTSGTRDAFVETALERGARTIACLADLEARDNEAFKRRVQTLREDGRWIDAGENDNSVVQILINTPNAVGVVGYSFLAQNRDKITGLSINGFAPDFENIRAGRYPIVRSLFIYLNGANFTENPAIAAYGLEFTSEQASGPGGYLEDVGLIPNGPDIRAEMRRRITERMDYREGQNGRASRRGAQ